MKNCVFYSPIRTHTHILFLFRFSTSHSAIHILNVSNFSCRITLLYFGLRSFFNYNCYYKIIIRLSEIFWSRHFHVNANKISTHCRTLCQQSHTATECYYCVLYCAVLWLLTFHLFENRLFIYYRFSCMYPKFIYSQIMQFLYMQILY